MRRRGHGYFDPFAAWRTGPGGLAGPGLHRDGVHLADYTGLAAEIVRQTAFGTGSSCRRPPRPIAPRPSAPLQVLRAAWMGHP
ncbi:hypothetical protein ACRBEV_21290 [Methylobacterium phyllosphaerae]